MNPEAKTLVAMFTLVVGIGVFGAVVGELARIEDEEPPATWQPRVPQGVAIAKEDIESTIRLNELSLDLARSGRYFLENRPRGFRDDCSGFVSAVVSRVGVPMDARVRQQWSFGENYGSTHYHPVPIIGDLVFFDNTNDANHNRRWDDLRTHIALVIDVEPDGTVAMVHNGAKSGRSIIKMNLFEPHVYKNENGEIKNSYLRSRGKRDPSYAMYLTGQLWSGFASVSAGEDWVAEDSNTHLKRLKQK
ncbi:MAG: hypothetical protein HN348_00520 [Proteobacteria bacterium]|jgi:hypothetical protein|nr:hypothetical protein [Pseudomonadota bacterium]